MSGYLLDTNAISILALPSKASAPSAHVTRFRAWVREHGEELFLSTITLAEIQAGISQLERKGSARRADALAHWLSAIQTLYDSRILPFTSRAALEAGRLLDRAIGAGADPGFEDAAIAATAAVHDLTVVTANARHFEVFAVSFFSPLHVPTERNGER
jgi:predicted nucleic acid-binding protein